MSVQEALNIGAYDLKRTANRNLAIGFGVGVLILGILLTIPSIGDILEGPQQEDSLFVSGPTTLADFQKEELETQEETPPDEVIPPPPPPPMAATQELGTGAKEAMGQLEASTTVVDGPEIADMSTISNANAIGGGDGGALAFDPNIEMPDAIEMGKGEQKISNNKPEEYLEFIPDGEMPKYSQSDLQKNVVYPSIALDNGIEGEAYLQVKIDKTGKIREIKVLKATHDSFRKAAEDAVRKTVFTPAVQNGYPVNASVTVRVQFKIAS